MSDTGMRDFDVPHGRASATLEWPLRWGRMLQRNRRFRATLKELNTLSDRELADLGLSRSMLRGLAWESSAGR